MVKNIKARLIYCIICIVLLSVSCEEDIILKIPEGEEKIVVEGYIEQDFPPYIILTRSLPYFSVIDLTQISNLFVHNAKIIITDKNNKSFVLQEIYINNLPDSLAEFAKDLFKVPSSDSSFFANMSIYSSFQLRGEVNNEYTLNVSVEGHTITAVTTIPTPVEFDSFWFDPPNDVNNDSMILLMGKYTDPPDEKNYYRYFTKLNNESYYPNRFYSVWDDVIFNGTEFTFAIIRGEDRLGEFNPDTYGYFWKGDTIMVKICTLDKTHYEFWSTFENDRYAGGPFSSPVLVQSNIEGGLGIWGGYGVSYHPVIIPE